MTDQEYKDPDKMSESELRREVKTLRVHSQKQADALTAANQRAVDAEGQAKNAEAKLNGLQQKNAGYRRELDQCNDKIRELDGSLAQLTKRNEQVEALAGDRVNAEINKVKAVTNLAQTIHDAATQLLLETKGK